MDPETDTAYFSYNYQANSTVHFFKRKLSRHLLRVNTPYLGVEETARSYSLTSEVITDRSYWDVTPALKLGCALMESQGSVT